MAKLSAHGGELFRLVFTKEDPLEEETWERPRHTVVLAEDKTLLVKDDIFKYGEGVWYSRGWRNNGKVTLPVRQVKQNIIRWWTEVKGYKQT